MTEESKTPTLPGWFIFGQPPETARQRLEQLLVDGPPPWRDFINKDRRTYYEHQLSMREMKVINAALFLRRPLIVTGEPGTGKSSLAYTIKKQLQLNEPVLVWSITSRSILKDALYSYDAIGRLQAAGLSKAAREQPPIEPYLTLGPLGTALADSQNRPRILLIDEIDKSDIDLPNDLLHLFEEGWFEIPELARLAIDDRKKKGASEAKSDPQPVHIRLHNEQNKTAPISGGRVPCIHFPIVIITSNRERELPAPLLRRCLRLHIPRPDREQLEKIVQAHFQNRLAGQELPAPVKTFIDYILEKGRNGEYIAPDQLMNAVHLLLYEGNALLEGLPVDLETADIYKDNEPLIQFVLDAISKIRLT